MPGVCNQYVRGMPCWVGQAGACLMCDRGGGGELYLAMGLLSIDVPPETCCLITLAAGGQG